VISTAPDGATVTAPIGPTDRGSLFRATRHRDDDRIVRLIAPRFCDQQFRDGLQRLREHPHPWALDIVAEGWADADYAVVYAVTPPGHTLGEVLARYPHWIDRLRVLRRLCDRLAEWQRGAQLPLGLGLHNIVVDGDVRSPRVLPCPAVSLGTPEDLFGTDPEVLAAIAPETVRGTPLNEPARDRYALGTLVARTLGCQPARLARDDDSRIEAQARGALLLATAEHSDVEPFLRATPQLRQLFETIRRYRFAVPEARPGRVDQLAAALAAVTDVIGLAETLRGDDPSAAVEVLSWVSAESPATEDGLLLRCLCRAGEILLERDEPALDPLDRAVVLAPANLDVRRIRSAALWAVLESTPADTVPDRVDDLIDDLEFVRRREAHTDLRWHHRRAEAYRRKGDLAGEAEALYEAVELDGGDIPRLRRYGRCLRCLGRTDEARRVVAIGKRRVDTMAAIGRITEEERQRWHRDFDSLLACPA
jgi:hypothetical protein